MNSTSRKSGYIYVWRCLANRKIYVGQQSKRGTARKTHHLGRLRKGRHHSSFMQEDWNNFGEGQFVFEIMEECPIKIITEREQWWVDFFDSTVHGYNVRNPVIQAYPSDRLSSVIKKSWDGDDSRRSATSQMRAEQWQNPEYLAQRKAGTTALWQDADYRSRVKDSIKESCNSPEYLTGLRERTRQQHANRRRNRRERLAAALARLSKFSHFERPAEEKAKLAKERRSAGHLAYWTNLSPEKKAVRTAHLASTKLQELATAGKRRRS